MALEIRGTSIVVIAVPESKFKNKKAPKTEHRKRFFNKDPFNTKDMIFVLKVTQTY